MWRGQDNEWRRLGARRRYDTTGLSPIHTWDDEHVRARRDELERTLAADAVAPAETPSETYSGLEAERSELAARIAEADTQVARTLADAGLEPGNLDPALSHWLDLHARAERARLELERVRARRKSARGDAESIRDGLYRYLSRRGEAPADGRADSDAIAARIDRLAGRGDGEE